MFPRPEPNSSRYFFARFKTFAQPQFWLAGLGLVGLLAFTWEFSQRSEWRQALTGLPETELTPEAKEEQAIGAEIDSLPLLTADLNLKKDGKVDLSAADAIAKIKLPAMPGDQGNKSTENDALAKLFGGGSSIAPTSNTATFTALNSALSNPLLSNSNNAPSASSNPVNPVNPLNPGNNTSRPNQLAEAISRYSVARPNPDAPIPVTPSEPNNSGFSPASTGLPIQGSAPINSANSNSNPWIPIAGSTNASPTGMNAYTGLSSGGIPDSIPDSTSVAAPIPLNTGIGSTPLPPGTAPIAPPLPPAATQVIVPDVPFSAPRSIPGRSIGGGEIGSFSNP
jgi:hypothetical protein